MTNLSVEESVATAAERRPITRRWRVVLVGGVLIIGGLLLGPLFMTPVYVELAPRLGAATLLVVELIFAFLIDVPGAALFVAGCRAVGVPPRNGARAAVGWAIAFFVSIGLCMILAPIAPLFAWLALADTFGPAAAASRRWLGTLTQGLLLVCYLVFDLVSCAAAGLAVQRLLAGGESDGRRRSATHPRV